MHLVLRAYHPLFALLLMLVLTGAAYWSGLSGSFRFDDIVNITENKDIHSNSLGWTELYKAAFSTIGGFRPLSMLSFGINHALTGLDSFYFKLTNLVIHLLCGVGVWWLTRLLLITYRLRHRPALTDPEVAWLSIAVSAAWLLHPFNLTSVLYVVQRMASLAALFMIFGLALYSWGRLRQLRGQSGAALMIVGVGVGGGLAVLSKENGILLPLLVLITEWLIFGFQAPKEASRRFVIGFNIMTVIIPGLLALAFLIMRFDWVVAGYETRDFTLSERLLTQARVLWFYIHMLLLPNPTLMGMYHDDIVLSKGWLNPSMTLPAVLGIIALLAGALALRRRTPLLSFGILFFLAGHALESTVISLEIAHEHRNYLPGFGLILVAMYYLGHSAIRELLSLRLQTGCIVVLIGALTAGTAIRASYWADEVELALMEVRHHPNSARSNMQAGYVFFILSGNGIDPAMNGQRARQYFEAAWRLDEYNLSGRFGLLLLDDREKKPVDTVLIDDLIDKLTHRPLAASSINTLVRIKRCWDEGGCNLPTKEFNRLFEAILKNSSLRGKSRVRILTDYAQFSITQNRLDLTLRLTQQALAIAPEDPQIHLNKAHILIRLGELNEAREAIAQAKILDRDAFLATQIREQEQLLERMLASRPLQTYAPIDSTTVEP